MTPYHALLLAQPLADLVADMEQDLMRDIARILSRDGGVTETAAWKLDKLAQMGALTKANLATIARYSDRFAPLAEEALRKSARHTINQLEPSFKRLVKDGFVRDTHVSPSNTVTRVLRLYRKQAQDDLNLVRTTMLYKAKQAYKRVVRDTAELADKDDFVRVLSRNTGEVVTGATSRQAALRKTLHDFAERGIPGFVDKAGHEWTPEAYVNMTIRSTVHNVATTAQMERMDDYGVDLIQIDKHSGARPKCARDQGKIFDRANRSTEYPHWRESSYGEPDGILGINCGHHGYPYIPGVSIRRYWPDENTDENDKLYQQKQKQRGLERGVRKSKRECAMLDELDDKAGFDKASDRLKSKEQRLQAYTDETGLTRKRDREAVMGFDRSVSSKATAAAKRVEKQRQDAIITKEIKQASGIRGDVHRTPKPIDTACLEFDAAHVAERGHNVTIDQAREYIRTARASVTRWGGRFENYYSDAGAAYVDTEMGRIRTAFSADEYDETTRKFLEELIKHGKG